MPSQRSFPLVFVLGVVAGLVLTLHLAPPENYRLVAAAVIVGFAIVSWTFGLLAEPLTTLLFFLLVVTFGISAPDVVFSGFASGAWWLMLGGSIIAAAVELTGLGHRLVRLAFGRWVSSYASAVSAVALVGVGLSFVMPSAMGRTLLLLPIVRAFAADLGLTPRHKGYIGLILTGAATSYMPSATILPSNIPNSILLGAADTLYGIKLTYGPYLLLHFPVLGLLKTLAMIFLVLWLFPERGALARRADPEPRALSGGERKLAILLAVALALYATDWLHGISPAWITLGTGILCLLPPVGMLTPKAVSDKTSIVTLMYVAGILGLGAVVADGGLGTITAEALLEITRLTPGDTIVNVATLSAIGMVLTMLTTSTGVPAVLTPLAGEFAQATGLPILTVLMLQVVSFSTVLLPYLSPPIMVWLQMGEVGVRDASKFCLVLGVITILVLLPIDYLWWRLLGYIP